MTPRPRSFDEATALRCAKELFWTKGYESTSMQNLVDAMGIGRQSLYNTFGDKQTLFLRALNLYIEEVLGGLFAGLNQQHSTLDELESFLNQVFHGFTQQEERRSCFLMNSILELAVSNEAVRELAKDIREKLVDSLEATLQRALVAGQLAAGVQPKVQASLIANTVMGLSLTWKAGASILEMETLVTSTVSALRADTSKEPSLVR